MALDWLKSLYQEYLRLMKIETNQVLKPWILSFLPFYGPKYPAW